ncbi:MAG: hypothetical protein RSC68_32485 [Acinetobacter sp.]
MHLEVCGKPTEQPTGNQAVVAVYDKARGLTTVTCDADIITVGIAAEVLLAKYREYLASCDEELANRIYTTIRKAVNNEEYRGSNSEPREHHGSRENDGCDGAPYTERPRNIVYGRFGSTSK